MNIEEMKSNEPKIIAHTWEGKCIELEKNNKELEDRIVEVEKNANHWAAGCTNKDKHITILENLMGCWIDYLAFLKKQ
jgi:hypothetical protein